MKVRHRRPFDGLCEFAAISRMAANFYTLARRDTETWCSYVAVASTCRADGTVVPKAHIALQLSDDKCGGPRFRYFEPADPQCR